MAILGSLVICLLKDPKPTAELDEEEPERQLQEAEEEESRPWEDVKETCKLMIEPRMLMIMPMIIWSAISVCIFGGIFISLMTRCMNNSGDPRLLDTDTQNSTALLCMALLGAGEIMGGTIFG